MSFLHTVNIKQIRYFIAVAEEKSFTKASQRLNMSQPPITQQIRLLEETLGTELFDRGSRQIELTLAGVELLRSAKSALRSLNGALEHARAVGKGADGIIRLGLTNDFIHSAIYLSIIDYSKENIGVPIEINVDTSTNLVDMLGAKALDLILTVKNTNYISGDFVELNLPPSRIVVMVPEAHVLAKKDYIAIRELQGQSLIVFREDSQLPLATECRRLLDQNQIKGSVRHFTSNTPAAVRLVEEGVGIAFASEFSVPPKITGVKKLYVSEGPRLEHVLMHNKTHLHASLTDVLSRIYTQP